MQKAKESYSRGFIKKQFVNVSLYIKSGIPIHVTINNFSFQSDVVPEEAKKNPISQEKIIEQFCKTGNTPFAIHNIQIEMDQNIFLPISTLNDIRRNAFKHYENYFLNSIKRKRILKTQLQEPMLIEHVNQPKSLSLQLESITKELNLILPKVDCIYVPLREVIEKEEIFKELVCKKIIVFPTITKGKYENLIKKNMKKLLAMCDGFVLSSICQLDFFPADAKTCFIANYSFNTFNSYTIDTLKSLGFSKVILSPELTTSQINKMQSSLPLELIVYGNQCIMTSEYCPIGSVLGGFSKERKCSMPCTQNDTYYLKDRMGMEFKVIPDNIDCQTSIYNCKITSIASQDVFVDSVLIHTTNETIKEISHIIDIHQEGGKLTGEDYTNAHSIRPV